METRLLPLCALLSACGLRHVPPPKTAAGYRQVEMREVSALGLHDTNVELIGGLGPVGSEDACGGVVTYALMGDGQTGGSDNVFGAMAATAPSLFTTAMRGTGSPITISLPRSRYAEVRDLRPFQRVRVRGYLSHALTHGCSRGSSDGNGNYLWVYLWVDSIAPVAATASP